MVYERRFDKHGPMRRVYTPRGSAMRRRRSLMNSDRPFRDTDDGVKYPDMKKNNAMK